jgi:predicted nucleic acid-binding protein
MRIVLDSNVLVRAVMSATGPAAAAYNLIQPPHTLLISTAVLDDLADGLRYPRVRFLHGLSDVEIDAAVQAMHESAETAPLPAPELVPIVSADRDDDFILVLCQTKILG